MSVEEIKLAPGWSETGIAAGIAMLDTAWVVVDKKGHRIDWPMLDSRETAEFEVEEFSRQYRQMCDDEESEALFFGR